MRDRRCTSQRRALVRRIIDEVFSQRFFALGVVECARLVGISGDACERILYQLERAGIVRQARPGVWTSAPRYSLSSWRSRGPRQQP
jgi:hypothetical protein